MRYQESSPDAYEIKNSIKNLFFIAKDKHIDLYFVFDSTPPSDKIKVKMERDKEILVENMKLGFSKIPQHFTREFIFMYSKYQSTLPNIKVIQANREADDGIANLYHK